MLLGYDKSKWSGNYRKMTNIHEYYFTAVKMTVSEEKCDIFLILDTNLHYGLLLTN